MGVEVTFVIFMIIKIKIIIIIIINFMIIVVIIIIIIIIIIINTYKYASCTDGKISEVTSTPTIPVENVVLTTEGLQERNTQMLAGTTVEK